MGFCAINLIIYHNSEVSRYLQSAFNKLRWAEDQGRPKCSKKAREAVREHAKVLGLVNSSGASNELLTTSISGEKHRILPNISGKRGHSASVKSSRHSVFQ